MDAKMIMEKMNAFFENTPQEHFDELWNEVKQFQQYGPTVEEYIESIQYSYSTNCSFCDDCKDLVVSGNMDATYLCSNEQLAEAA